MSKKTLTHLPMTSLGLVTALALAGCGGGGGGGGGGFTGSSGSLTVAITDAPVDDAQNVWIEFTEVEVQGADGTRHPFTLSPPKRIDLLALSDGSTVKLLDDQTLPAGDYDWIRLYVDIDNSSLVNSSGEHCLRIPSNANTGLKLNRPFTMTAEGVANFVIDFDLRKSIHAPRGQACFQMRPTLRIVDVMASGGLSGSIDPQLYVSDACALNPDVSSQFGAVYVYSGAGQTPDDMGGAGTNPLVTAQVVRVDTPDNPDTPDVNEESTSYNYAVSNLDAGPYTIAFACDAINDVPDDGDATNGAEDDDLTFYGTTDVSISNETDTVHDFVAPAP